MRLAVEERDGRRLFCIDGWDLSDGVRCLQLQPRSFEVRFPSLPLAPGNYLARIWLVSALADIHEEVPCFVPVTVHDGPVPGTRAHERGIHGVIATDVQVSGAERSRIPVVESVAVTSAAEEA